VITRELVDRVRHTHLAPVLSYMVLAAGCLWHTEFSHARVQISGVDTKTEFLLARRGLER